MPGQKLAALNGEFVPGAWVQSEEGVQFLPGCFNTTSTEGSNDLIQLSPQTDSFIAGQFIEQVFSKAIPLNLKNVLIEAKEYLSYHQFLFKLKLVFKPYMCRARRFVS